MPGLEFRILGPLEVESSGGRLPLGPPAQRAVLLALILHVNKVTSTDRLIDLVWGEHPPPSAGNLIQGYISGLRKVLEPGRRTREPARTLRSHPEGYVLNTDPARIDAVRFEELAREGQRLMPGQPARAAEVLREALALWRGPALGSYDFASVEASRLEALRLVATEDLFETELAQGSHRLLVPELESFVAEHPLRERAQCQLITALYRSGRQADALAVYSKARGALLEELGLDPGPDLQRLEGAILRHDPALAVPLAPASNLPRMPTSFVGRDHEIELVRELLKEGRLLTLTGSGGCGKTRLALSVAESSARRYRDGVWFIDLSPLEDARLVIQAIASPFGLRRDSDAALLEALSSNLATKSALLVIDNCEHLDSVGPVVDSLLRSARGLTVIATSREPLGLSGETIFRVPPLSVPEEAIVDPVELRRFDAVLLFAARAGAARPAFRLEADSASEVARICRRLEGMPLAIELAAPFVGVLSVRQIADRIDDFPDLLETMNPVAPARQRTIQATIRWSYDLLTEPERVFLDRLCTFAGAFTFEGADALAGQPGAARADLPRLVAKSMVSEVRTSDSPSRFRILDSVREFGLRRLQGRREIDPIREVHAGYLLDVVDRAGAGFRGPESPRHLDRLQQEMDDIHSALRWSFGRGDELVGVRMVATLWWLWFLRGPFGEAAEWIDSALDRRARAEPHVRMRLLNGAAALAMPQGDFDRVVALSSEHLMLAREEGNDGETAEALEPLAVAAWVRGDYPEARRLLEEAIARSDAVGSSWSSAGETALLGRILADQGDGEGARGVLRDAVGRARSVGEPFNIAIALDFSAALDSSSGRDEEAATNIDEGLALYREVGYQEGIASALNTTAAIARRAQDATRAADAYAESLELCLRTGNVGGIPECLEGLAWTSSRGGDPESAARLMGAASSLRERLSIPLPASARHAYDDLEGEVRAGISSGSFEEAWAEGRDMDPQAAGRERRTRRP